MAPTRRVSTPKGWRYDVVGYSPLRLTGGLLRRTSENSSYEHFINRRTSEKPNKAKFALSAFSEVCAD
jgi:hypothetical protein